jgi:short-subunit dehydrogenase
MKTKAVRLYGKNELRLEEFELPEIRDDEIEVLINNAGFGLKPVFTEVPKEDRDGIMFLQMNTVVIITQHILKQMMVRNRGTIINISSDGAFAVMPRNILYSSTKLFILNFSNFEEIYKNKQINMNYNDKNIFLNSNLVKKFNLKDNI